MKAILFPYPYKLHVDGELMDGAFFPVPSFCRHSCSSKECRNFYHKEGASIGHKKCPYGFGVDGLRGKSMCSGIDILKPKEEVFNI